MYFKVSKHQKFNKGQIEDVERFCKIENIPFNEAITYFSILTEHQNQFTLSRFRNKLRNTFLSSYKNPFDAPGLVILGYIISSYSYFAHEYIAKK
jgi:uncharacterized circularly permuted ATP-grasp superfamily protein